MEVIALSPKLKSSIINIFSLGPIGFFLMMNFIGTYYSYFLTDILKISAATVGTLVLASRVIDTFTVPVAGGMVEKIHFPWGRYSGWLWLAPPISTLFVTLMFTNPNFGHTATIIFLGAIYILAHMSINLTEAAHYALMPVIAYSDEDRVLLSARRAQAMSAGSLIFGFVAVPMIAALGGNDEGRGLFLTVLIFSLLQLAGYWMAAKVSMPFDTKDTGLTGKQAGLLEMAGQIFKNKPLAILIVAEVCRWSASLIVMNLSVYYFKYVAIKPVYFTAFLTSRSVATMAGTAVGQYFARRTSKIATWNIGTGINLLLLVIAWFFYSNPPLFIVLHAIAAVGHSIVMTLSAAFLADVAEYTEWKTKANARGIVMSLGSLPVKISMALAGAVAGYSLSLVGYVPDTETTHELAAAMGALSTLLPAVFAVLALVLIRFYPLTEHKVRIIRKRKERSMRNQT
jgi:sugar (glycoside-pentoside-hexuronide) transporter